MDITPPYGYQEVVPLTKEHRVVLPADHPLWRLPNCIITPHVGNTPEMAVPLLSERITANAQRFAAGEPLIGHVDTQLGY